MSISITKKMLCDMLLTGGSSYRTFTDHNNKFRGGIFQGVEREDGSGNNFNITMLIDGKRQTFFCHIDK